jgi:prepilin-type N-terminal cleavage/methylation domain-containing protein
MRHSPSRRRSGFTFIEILVVFVVFAAVMAISVPAVGDTLRRDRVAKVGAIVGTDIEQAFSIAARQRLPVRIVVKRDSLKLYIQDRNTPTLVYKTRTFTRSGEYSVDSLWSNRDTIDIMPNGIATDTLKLSFIIYTKNGATYQKSVRSSIGGLVRLDNR